MDELTVKLASLIVDNPPGPSTETKAKVRITDRRGGLTVRNYEGGPLSYHQFVITDASNVGLGAPTNLTKEKAQTVFAIACSLTTDKVLFCSSQLKPLVSSISHEFPPATVHVRASGEQQEIQAADGPMPLEDAVTTGLGAVLEVSEQRVLDVAHRLLKTDEENIGGKTRICPPGCLTNLRAALSDLKRATSFPR